MNNRTVHRNVSEIYRLSMNTYCPLCHISFTAIHLAGMELTLPAVEKGQIFGIHRISSELSRKVRVSEESLILRFGGQVSSRFKLKWVEEVKLYRKSVFDDCSIA